MMASFLDAATTYIGQTWHVRHLLLVVLAAVLALVLRRVAPRLPGFVWQMLMLVIVLFVGSAVAAGLHSHTVARPLHELAVLILGMVLIRQLCLVFFRLIIVRLGMRPPRILEEILILLAFVGWILVRLSMAGLELGSLVASTAVLTAVLAFAMQDTLGNILSGLALQLDHSVHIGDWISIDDVSGEVVQVQWRHTAIRTLFGEMILVPNSQLMKAKVVLIGGPSVPRRIRVVLFHAPFDLQPASVIHAVEQALAQAEAPMMASSPAPTCIVQDFAQGVATYAVRYWLTDPIQQGRGDSLVRQHVHAVFQREGWQLAAPGMDIHMQAEPSANDRAGLPLDEERRRLDLLQATGLFTPLTDEEMRALAQGLKPVHYVAGSLLARQGDVGDCLYIVAAGQTGIWVEAESGRHLIARPGPGEVVGEMSLMTGEPRRATISAHSDLDCYVLDQSGFQGILRQRPELADAFAQLLAARKQELTSLSEHAPVSVDAVEKAALLARIRNLFRL